MELCSDAKGNVWLTTWRYSDHETEVVEFAHGATTPFAAINGAGNNPRGCSVDPASGDLAVATYGGGSSNRNPGNVVVFPAAPKYPPVTYKVARDAHFFFCTYDANGNLYVDGISASNDFVFYELPKGASGFVAVTLNHAISGPGGVQWDGSHVAVADSSSFQIFIDLRFRTARERSWARRRLRTPLHSRINFGYKGQPWSPSRTIATSSLTGTILPEGCRPRRSQARSSTASPFHGNVVSSSNKPGGGSMRIRRAEISISRTIARTIGTIVLPTMSMSLAG